MALPGPRSFPPPPSPGYTRGEVTSDGCQAPPEVGDGPGSGARPVQPCSVRPGGASRGHGAGREQVAPARGPALAGTRSGRARWGCGAGRLPARAGLGAPPWPRVWGRSVTPFTWRWWYGPARRVHGYLAYDVTAALRDVMAAASLPCPMTSSHCFVTSLLDCDATGYYLPRDIITLLGFVMSLRQHLPHDIITLICDIAAGLCDVTVAASPSSPHRVVLPVPRSPGVVLGLRQGQDPARARQGRAVPSQPGHGLRKGAATQP